MNLINTSNDYFDPNLASTTYSSRANLAKIKVTFFQHWTFFLGRRLGQVQLWHSVISWSARFVIWVECFARVVVKWRENPLLHQMRLKKSRHPVLAPGLLMQKMSLVIKHLLPFYNKTKYITWLRRKKSPSFLSRVKNRREWRKTSHIKNDLCHPNLHLNAIDSGSRSKPQIPALCQESIKTGSSRGGREKRRISLKVRNAVDDEVGILLASL